MGEELGECLRTYLGVGGMGQLVREQTGPKPSNSGMSMFIIEDGCFLLSDNVFGVYLFRCVSTTSGEAPSEMERIKLKPIT